MEKFNQAIEKMLSNKYGKNEFEKICNYEGYTVTERKKAKHDYELVQNVYGKVPAIMILHELKSAEVLKDIISLMGE